MATENVAGNMPDDQPLSTTLSKMRKHMGAVDALSNFPCRPINQSHELDDEQKRFVPASPEIVGECKIVPREILSLPFVKNIQLWEMIESMEVFKRMPQMPHFCPLYDCNENIREGLAVGSMVTFSSVVEISLKLRFNDSRSAIENCLEALVELDSFGFSVKATHNRLTRLLLAKDRHEELQVKMKEIESGIQENNIKKTKTDEGIQKIDQQLRELQQKRAMMSKVWEVKDSQVSSLHSKLEEVDEGIKGAVCDFERLAIAPL